MNLDFPWHFDARGRSALTDDREHVRDLIEQVLFTTPGERVNRPDFGCGLLQLAFAPLGDTLAATVQMTVQGALQRWLGDLIVVEAVEIDIPDSTLHVQIHYVLRRTQQRDQAQFEHTL